MTPHEREQLLELAEQIVLDLRRRLAGIDNLNARVSDLDSVEFQERLPHGIMPRL